MIRSRYGLIALAVVSVASLAAPAIADFDEQVQFGSGFTIPMAWGDADLDGDLDLAVGNYSQQNQLFLNNGDGSFTLRSDFGAGRTFAVAWGDYDNDGDPDLAVANGYGEQNWLWVNDGAGNFTGEPQFGLAFSNAVAWGDADLDGDLDLAVGNGLLNSVQQNRLYLNNGDGTFTGQDQFGTGETATVVWCDYDQDGDLDLAAGNGGFHSPGQQNYLYVNNGDGTFEERPEFGTGDTSSMVWGDADNDGDCDLAVANWESGACQLYLNLGDDTFMGVPQFGDRDTNTFAWGDFDHDGRLDLAVGNGDFQTADSNFVYINQGGGQFLEQGEFGQGSTDAVVWGDFDADGDLDLAAGNEHSPPQNYLYVNDRNDGDYLIVRLVGRVWDQGPGYSNRDGIGAVIAAYEPGFAGSPEHLLGLRPIEAHGGFSSQNQLAAHFGVPGVDTVDLVITWPGSSGSNVVQTVDGVQVGQVITVDEWSGTTGVGGTAPVRTGSAIFRATPNPMRRATLIELVPRAGSLERLDIYNILGQNIRTLELSPPAGGDRYQILWDGTMGTGERAPAGLYLVRGWGRGAESSAGRILVLR